ncbi:MAG TPA: hypothetical protein VJ418_13420, partial [Streptosporangiaceae bacterium]|nr:hypothetical protein [Streptosporangiaceae bacterium]
PEHREDGESLDLLHQDSLVSAVATALRTAGWAARTAGAGPAMPCWAAKPAVVSGSSTTSAVM